MKREEKRPSEYKMSMNKENIEGGGREGMGERTRHARHTRHVFSTALSALELKDDLVPEIQREREKRRGTLNASWGVAARRGGKVRSSFSPNHPHHPTPPFHAYGSKTKRREYSFSER